MTAYATALHSTSLAGPTVFGPVINKAAQIAGQSLSHNNTKYYVFLIITVQLYRKYMTCHYLIEFCV